MLRAATINSSTTELKTGSESLIAEWKKTGESWIWIDLEAPEPELEIALLKQFSISDLAISDARRARHPPKFEVFDDYYFLLVRGLDAEITEFEYKVMQMALFVGKNFLITRRSQRSVSIDRVWAEMLEVPRTVARGPELAAYKISRCIADRYTPILMGLEDRLEELEAHIFANPDDQLLMELTEHNGNLKKMRRTLAYQKGIFSALTRHIENSPQQEYAHQFVDVYEQFERLASLAALYQELVVDLSNAFISLASHRLNNIMKVLTITTVVFLPLTLLAGIYGMNFDHIPELHWKFGYFAVLGFMTILAVTMFLGLRKMKWL